VDAAAPPLIQPRNGRASFAKEELDKYELTVTLDEANRCVLLQPLGTPCRGRRALRVPGCPGSYPEILAKLR
jgi:hypothetical protein